MGTTATTLSNLMGKLRHAKEKAELAQTVNGMSFADRQYLEAFLASNGLVGNEQMDQETIEDLKTAQEAVWKDPMVAYNYALSEISAAMQRYLDSHEFMALWRLVTTTKLPGGNIARPIITAFNSKEEAQRHITGVIGGSRYRDPIVVPHVWFKDQGRPSETIASEGNRYYLPTGRAELEAFGHLKTLRARAAEDFIFALQEQILFDPRLSIWIALHLFDGGLITTSKRVAREYEEVKGTRLLVYKSTNKAERLMYRWYRLGDDEVVLIPNTPLSKTWTEQMIRLRAAWMDFCENKLETESLLIELVRQDVRSILPIEFLDGAWGRVAIQKTTWAYDQPAQIVFDRLVDGRWRIVFFNKIAAEKVLKEKTLASVLRFSWWLSPLKMPENIKDFIRSGTSLTVAPDTAAQVAE